MASTTSDSLPSSPSLPTAATALDGAADQEFSSSHHHHHHHHHHHQSLFLPSSSSAASLYLDSTFHGLLPTSTAMSSPSPPPPAASAPPLPPAPAAPSKPAKKRPRASRRPPTTVLTTDTSNFRAMVQEFTGFPAPPFAPAPPPAVRPRLFGGVGSPSFLMRPSPLKYPGVLLPPSSCTTTLANATINAGGAGGTSSLVDALALFAKSNAMPSGGGSATAATSGGGSGAAADHYHGGIGMGMGGFNPFDDFDPPAAAAEGERGDPGGGHGFFSSFATGGDKYGRH